MRSKLVLLALATLLIAPFARAADADRPAARAAPDRSGAGESLVVVANLSSRPYTGLVEVGAGTYRDVTPGLDANAARAVAPPAVFLAPWEFRVFRRAIP
jgi:hypothetical protein